MTKPNRSITNDILVITDDQTWIWGFSKSCLERRQASFVRLPSDVRIRQSWQRFREAQKIVIHWENKQRHGGAIIEEILEVAPDYNVSHQIIVLTTDPTHEDVVYFSELGVRQVIRLRNREKDLVTANQELEAFLKAELPKEPHETEWYRIQRLIDHLPETASAEHIAKIQKRVDTLAQGNSTSSARALDSLAALAALTGNNGEAEKLWRQALEKNPNFFRAYNNLIELYKRTSRHKDALALMQKMQALNTSNISRLVGMGEIYVELEQSHIAEHYFKTALDRDAFCNGALNGLAEIRFHQGQLEESRRLLARSSVAYRTAARLNNRGIELVHKSRFSEALDLYTKAQYVLPQQDKSPLLFYNIGLCYSRWGKPQQAIEFLKIALVKEPNYKKADKLLSEVVKRSTKAA